MEKENKKTSVIKYIAVIPVLVLLFLLIWEGLRYILIDDSGSYTRVAMHEYYNQEKIDAVFIGASHCYRSFDTSVIDEATGLNTFNLGSSSQPIEVTYLLLKDVVKRYHPQHVYIELCYNVAKHGELQLNSTYLITDYMRPSLDKYLLLARNSDDDTFANSFLIARRNSEKIFDFEYIADLIKRKGSDAYKNYDYVDNGTEWYAGKGFVASTVQVTDGSFIDSRKDEEYDLDLLEKWRLTVIDMADYCYENGIQVTFVSAPISSYRLSAYGDYDSYINYATELLAEHHAEYVDFNLLKEAVWADTSAYFMDYSHLNGQGAKLFSEIFASYMTGELDTEEAFYGSVKEKYESVPANFYGLLYDDGGDGDIISNEILSANDDGWLYRVSAEENGQIKLISDWSNGKTFELPRRYTGNCYIEVVSAADPGAEVIRTYTINIKY